MMINLLTGIAKAIAAFFRYLWDSRLVILGRAEAERDAHAEHLKKIQDGLDARSNVTNELPARDKYRRD